MKRPARVAGEPLVSLVVLVSRTGVEDDVDFLILRDLTVDRTQQADEFLVPVALHGAADGRAVQDIAGGEQRGGAVALMVVGHRSRSPGLDRQTRLRPVQRLNLALLVDRQHHGMGRRRDVETDDVGPFLGEARILGDLVLNDRQRWGTRPRAFQIAWTVDAATRAALAMARSVQWVASCGGGSCVSRTISATTSSAIGALPGGRLLSRSSPPGPSSMKRSCQRQTPTFDSPVSGLIAMVPRPSSLNKTMRARQTCFCGLARVRDDRFEALTVGGRDVERYSFAHA